MTVCYILVNYKNSVLSRVLVDSLLNGVLADLDAVILVDNSVSEDEKSRLEHIRLLDSRIFTIFNTSNIGYFPALNIGIDYAKSLGNSFDFFVVGNNDLVFPPTFRDDLNSCAALINKVPVIAPRICSPSGEDQNPHVRNRNGVLKEFVYDLFYWNFTISRLMMAFSKCFARFKGNGVRTDLKEGSIHQGYGACYILTRCFFKHFPALLAPSFLMHEEAFLAFQLSQKGFETYFYPSVWVEHRHHGSTGKIKDKLLWQFGKQSHREFRNLF